MASEAKLKTAALRIEPTPKWVRARGWGHWVVDSRKAHLVYWEYRPQAYAVPEADLIKEVQIEAHEVREHRVFGRVKDVSLVKGKDRIEHAGRYLLDADDPTLIAVHWNKMDAWFEEDEQVFIHPRAPDHRIEILRSTRHITVDVDGVRVADTRRPTILLETGLPARYYIPRADVDWLRLRPSNTTTGCPYKGFAEYYHVETDEGVRKDIVWSYQSPFPESQKIMGLAAFYNEHVDIEVDGEPEIRPKTMWS